MLVVCRSSGPMLVVPMFRPDAGRAIAR
jgi:hypothetical protein